MRRERGSGLMIDYITRCSDGTTELYYSRSLDRTRKSSKYHRIEIVTVVECVVYDEHVEWECCQGGAFKAPNCHVERRSGPSFSRTIIGDYCTRPCLRIFEMKQLRRQYAHHASPTTLVYTLSMQTSSDRYSISKQLSKTVGLRSYNYQVLWPPIAGHF